MKLSIAIALAIASSSVLANDEANYARCNGILADGAYNTYLHTNNIDTKIALKKWLCSSDSGSENGSGSASLNVFGLFSVGGGGGDVDTWKREHCEGSDYDYANSKSTHILMKTASPVIVNAWSECMKNQPGNSLVCYATETEDSLLMKLKLDGNSGIGDVRIVNIGGSRLNALSGEPQPGEYLTTGTRSIRYEKVNPNREAYFDFNGQAQNLSVSCSYTIPKKPKMEDPQECEDVRYDAFRARRITARDYEYMRDNNMVPLFNPYNGRYEGGYHCDMYMNR